MRPVCGDECMYEEKKLGSWPLEENIAIWRSYERMRAGGRAGGTATDDGMVPGIWYGTRCMVLSSKAIERTEEGSTLTWVTNVRSKGQQSFDAVSYPCPLARLNRAPRADHPLLPATLYLFLVLPTNKAAPTTKEQHVANNNTCPPPPPPGQDKPGR